MLSNIWKKLKRANTEEEENHSPKSYYEIMDEIVHPYLEEVLVDEVDFRWDVVNGFIVLRLQDDISFEPEVTAEIDTYFLEYYYDTHGDSAVQKLVEHTILITLGTQRWVKSLEE